MNDEQLLRYNRHIMLPQIDIVGQQQLLDSHVLLIGVGGLGSPIALYLASAGIGRLSLADDDHVELSNLQRQIAHDNAAIGMHKVRSAAQRCRALNPDIAIIEHPYKLDESNLDERIQEVDLVLDASDNFATRFAINAACFRQRKPLIFGAAIRMEAQISVFRPELGCGPCYQCLYPKQDEENAETCSENGVLAPLLGIIGSIQATEAIKLLTGSGSSLCGRLLLLDANLMEWQQIALPSDPNCPICQHIAV